MKLITWFLRLINYRKGEYQIWDTSAIIAFTYELVQIANSKPEGLSLIVPEGVLHELSVNRNRTPIREKRYKFIYQNENIIKEVTKDKIRNWTVDEQVIAVADSYNKRGYNVKIVTCDLDLSNRAKLKGIECIYKNVSDSKEIFDVVPKEVERAPKLIRNNVKSNNYVKHWRKNAINPSKVIKISYQLVGKEKYIDLNTNLSVYDPKGKRRIGRDGKVLVGKKDSFELRGEKYRLLDSNENDNYFIIEKI